MIQKYKQTTYETCLASSLLLAVSRIKSKKITPKEELACINHSMKFSRDDFVIGHLDYIVNKYNVKIMRIVDSKLFYNYVQQRKISEKIRTYLTKVNIWLLNKLLTEYEPIVYMDRYYLYKDALEKYHWPHFVTILKKKGSKYKIIDTWDGKIKLVDTKLISKAISSLRNHLKFSSQIVIVK